MTAITDMARQYSRVTIVEYSLMVLLGGSSILLAFAPVSISIKQVGVALLFGLTAGLWLSHLIVVLDNALTQADGR
ncbi:MAG: hypothetical protein SVG88_10295 [Halobacteriales archaeon]|nr:hypothetical protein [Halobacteriales archaeon]